MVTVLHATKWLSLLQRGKWIYASRRGPTEAPRIDAVNLIAWHTDQKGHMRLVVLEEFREVIGQWEYGLPAGIVEPGEDLFRAAARELKEETGFLIRRTGFQSDIPLFSSTGMTDETQSFVEGVCEGQVAERPGVDNEQIRVMLLDRQDCQQLLHSSARTKHPMSVRLWPILVSVAQTGSFCGRNVFDREGGI